MLVLTRKVGEEIVIGGNIRVRVLSIQGNQIRLGFVAPREIPIQRQELLASDPVNRRIPKPDAVIDTTQPTTALV